MIDPTQLRKELLQARLREDGLLPESSTPETTPAPTPSDVVHRMWFHQKYAPSDTTLNICVGYRLIGPLDLDRLHRAVDAVAARHEILRTTYHLADDGNITTVVRPDTGVRWRTHDLTDRPEDARAATTELITRREFAQPFDLGIDSVLRVTVIRDHLDNHVLLLTIHHICWDDACWPIFFDDLRTAYTTDSALPTAGKNTAGPTGRDSDYEADIEYWRNVMRPVPEPIELPGAGRSTSPRARRVHSRITPTTMTRVRACAQAHGATPFMVLLAAFQAVLRRYCDSDDFLVAVPVIDRRAADTSLGCFGNTVLLRCRPERDSTFEDLVTATRDHCAAAFAHQSTSVSRIVGALHPQRTAQDDLTDLVRVSFAARAIDHLPTLPAITATRLEYTGATTQLPIDVTVEFDTDGGADIRAAYRIDAVDDVAVSSLTKHFAQLLDQAIRDPGRVVSRLELFDDEERAALDTVIRGPAEPVRPDTLPAMVERAVVAHAEDIAVCDTTGDYSYRELDRRANRMARWLIGHGIGPDDIVALPMKASADFVIAVLGVLKSGGAYLPIEPDYPADRIAHILDDARPQLVLDRDSLSAGLAAAAALPEHRLTDRDRRAPLRPGNLAYLIYTSGSTGKPKGVAVDHGAITDHLVSMQQISDLTTADRWLQIAPPSFDASVSEIFMTLQAGARLVVPAPDDLLDLDRLGELVENRGITIMHMVPALLGVLLMMPTVSRWKTLRRIPMGGEALPGELAGKAMSVFNAALSNHYGPTEAVVASTVYPITGPESGIVPIGRAHRNVEVHLLDSALQPVPTTVAGEIYLGGPQLARGYRYGPGRTAERFVAAPGGVRWYRTGDVARRDSSGTLEFLGRADEQVKIRGFRVELGEIEAALTNHPDVAQAVVIATRTPEIGTILVGYPVAAPTVRVLDPTRIRSQLTTVLPAHMVPTVLMAVDAIPVTAHGKLDRAALPTPELTTPVAYRPATTPTEIRLSGLFAQLLGNNEVGVDDSFFALGGHSLLAGRLITRIRAEFGVQIDLRAAFDAPTVAALAAVIDTAQPTGTPALVAGPRPERIPLSHMQQALWWNIRLAGSDTHWHIPLAVRFDGPLDVSALRHAINDVTDRHEALRTVFRDHDGVPYQVILPQADLDVPLVACADDGQLEQHLAKAATREFRIDSEPLIRSILFECSPRVYVLSVVVHHLIADHWSLRTLMADLATAYAARAEGQAPGWRPLPAQYADYVLHQQELSDREKETTEPDHLRYWRSTLADLPVETSPASDRPRPAVLGRRGEVAHSRVSPTVRARLRELADSCRATEFMICQAAVATALHASGVGDDVIFGTPVAGSDDGIAGMVGLFINMVVLRHDVSGNPTLRELLSRARDTTLDALTHHDLPIERLVRELAPPRSLGRNPLFQVMMHYRDQDWATGIFDSHTGLAVTILPTAFDIAHLDLSLNIFVNGEGGFDVSAIANADLYTRDTAAAMADRLAAMFAAFADRPDATLRELGLAVAVPRRSAALPPQVTRSADDEPPSTDTERLIASLLGELLDIEDIGRHDGFFALGGDSVLSLQWAAQAANAGVNLTAQMVFEYQTIDAIAAAIDTTSPARTADIRHEPMSVSGLTPSELRELTDIWQEQP